MPKARRTSARHSGGVELQVAPWQERPRSELAHLEQDKIDVDGNVLFCDLLRKGLDHVVGAAAPLPASRCQAQPTPGPWRSARNKADVAALISGYPTIRAAHDAGLVEVLKIPGAGVSSQALTSKHSNHRSALLQPRDQSGRTAETTKVTRAAPATALHILPARAMTTRLEEEQQAVAQPAAILDSDEGFGLIDKDQTVDSMASCTGLCQLALLPSGQMSGHFIDSGSQRAYGLVGEDVVGASSGCLVDDDTEVVCLKLLNFRSGEEVRAVVAKSGGDLARLRPAEPWHLARGLSMFGSEADDEPLVQVDYEATTLLEGAAAEAHLSRFSPRLIGSGAVVNMGQMQLSGVPAGFFCD